MVAFIICWIASILIAEQLADFKGHNRFMFGVGALFFGPIAAIYAMAIPDIIRIEEIKNFKNKKKK